MYSISDITEESQNSSRQSGVDFDHSQILETSLSNNPNGTIDDGIISNGIMNISNGTSSNRSTNSTNGRNMTSDVNPLLNEAIKVEKRKRPLIVKRSPNFTRASSRIHPVISCPPQMENDQLCSIEMVSRTTDLNMLTTPGSRPTSLPFTRSTSAIDLPEVTVVPSPTGHKRSLSYGAQGAYLSQTGEFSALIYNMQYYNKYMIYS